VTHPVNVPSSAFNVERARAQMLENVQIPPDLVQHALDKVREKLDAKKTQFFSYQGQVVEQVEVEDHGTQLAAIDTTFKMAGVYARERDAAPATPTVSLEMDTNTGVVRLVVGSISQAPPLVELPSGDTTAGAVARLPLVVNAPKPEAHTALVGGPDAPQEEDSPPQVVKVRRGNLPVKVFDALFGEPDA